VALAAVFGNLTQGVSNQQDTNQASEFMNNFYFGLSRPSWVFGVFLICLAIFTGHFGIARAILSSGNMRAVGKTMIVSCVIQIVVIEMLFCSQNAPSGISLTPTTCLLFGLGFMLCPILIGLAVLAVVEFPIARFLQMTVYPYISHDPLLAKHWEIKQ